MRDFWMNMVNTTYISKDDMINKLQQIKGKTKLKLFKKLSNYYDDMNIRFDEDPFPRNAQPISKIYHEVLLIMKFLQTKHKLRIWTIIIMIYIILLSKIEKKKNFLTFLTAHNGILNVTNENNKIYFKETITNEDGFF